MDAAAVEQVRRFNRMVTQRIGALNDRYMARDRALGESRVLWEIGADGIDVRMLRRRLELDSGYLSRLLRSLERAGLVVVERDAEDRRVRRARLTGAGLAERATLDRLSDELAWSLLEPLTEAQRSRLVAALGVVERLVTAGLVQLEVADPSSVGARHCIGEYFRELDTRFEHGFDASRSIPADADELTEPAGLLLLARLHRAPVGCGAVKFHNDGVAEIKRMWVDPSARGLGLGRRILSELERRARLRGMTMARLETNQSLTEAIALYCNAGYAEVPAFNAEPYAHHWFEKRLGAESG
jgi:DNA-binding MarR family transcriptional regulator/GNAT superfamily N-acetyltransferase